MTSIIVSDLSVTYADERVLVGIDLVVDPGSIVCVVGPNGAGKSTLLAAMAGEPIPVSGSVTIGGVDPASLRPADRVARRAYLGQSERADVPYSVRTVVSFGTAASRLDGQARHAAVTRRLEELGLEGVLDRRVAELSGGERRRVAVARTLVQDAPALLMDEPTDSLDLGHANDVMHLAAQEARAGRAVVVTSHDLNLAARHADRVVVLSSGRIVAAGDPADVLTPDLLSDVYACDVRVFQHPEDGRPVIHL